MGSSWIFSIFIFIGVSIKNANQQVLHHHPDHLHNPVHADIITKHFGDVDVDFEHNVLILTKDNFYHLVGAHEILLALFHVSWDQKFLEVIDEYEKAAATLQKELPSVVLGRMDVSEHPEIARKLDLRGEEPQFMFFYRNRAYNFEHPFKAESIVKEITKRHEAIWYPPQNDPEQLTELSPAKIEKALAKKEFAVCLMYSPTRVSSLRLLMEMENAAAKLNYSDTFFKVNVADSKELRNTYGIPPVVKIYRKGRTYDYKGPKVTKGIVNYLRGQMQPPFVRIYTAVELENFLKTHQDRPTVVGYFKSEKLAQFRHFEDAANHFRGDLYFVLLRQFIPVTTWKEHKDDEEWRVGVLLPKHDSDPELVQKDESKSKENLQTLDELLRFIEYKAIPVVGHRNKKNKDTAYKRRPLVVGYMKVDWSASGEKETRFVRHKIAQVAIEYPVGQINFAISNAKDFKDELQRFGFKDQKGETEDLQMGIMGPDGEYYPLQTDGPVQSQAIKDFVEKYLKGELKPYYRSEAVLPEAENTDPVKIVVGASFADMVLNTDKEVLISFCHPLCRMCKTVEENMLKIAQREEYKSVSFLAMDTSLNDPPATYPVKTYPTLYFATGTNRTAPVKYTGKDFSTKELYAFLDKNVQSPRVTLKNEL